METALSQSQSLQSQLSGQFAALLAVGLKTALRRRRLQGAMDYAGANRAYTESSVLTAPPERLVVMLYDGAIRFLKQAAVAERGGQHQMFLDRLRRAEAIIDELNVTLDMSQGEVAARLRSIYLFCKRHLVEAHLKRDPSQHRRGHPSPLRPARELAAARRPGRELGPVAPPPQADRHGRARRYARLVEMCERERRADRRRGLGCGRRPWATSGLRSSAEPPGEASRREHAPISAGPRI